MAVHTTKLQECFIIDPKGNSEVECPLGNNERKLQGPFATVTEKSGTVPPRE